MHRACCVKSAATVAVERVSPHSASLAGAGCGRASGRGRRRETTVLLLFQKVGVFNRVLGPARHVWTRARRLAAPSALVTCVSRQSPDPPRAVHAPDEAASLGAASVHTHGARVDVGLEMRAVARGGWALVGRCRPLQPLPRPPGQPGKLCAVTRLVSSQPNIAAPAATSASRSNWLCRAGGGRRRTGRGGGWWTSREVARKREQPQPLRPSRPAARLVSRRTPDCEACTLAPG